MTGDIPVRATPGRPLRLAEDTTATRWADGLIVDDAEAPRRIDRTPTSATGRPCPPDVTAEAGSHGSAPHPRPRRTERPP